MSARTRRRAETQAETHSGAGRIAHFGWLGPLALAFYAFLYSPIVVLIAYSFNDSRFAMIWQGFSLKWYATVLENGDIQTAALNSLVVATAATAISVSIATVAALALARGGAFRGKTLSMGLIALPIVVPEIVTAVATLMFFSAIGLSLGLGNLIIAHTVFCIPFAFMPIRARLQGMDETLEQAAADLYASRWEAFRLVTLPLLAPGIFAGAVLAFVISLDDFIISLMISDAGTTTLPVYIFSMIRRGVTPEVNAVSTILFSVSLVLVSIYWLASRPKKDEA
ncbi:MAG: ABC transporter permease [Alphaproteobacteria bacterium]|nr:MAG: ABC transporter permease [Alphaproteobacteria bacterium]